VSMTRAAAIPAIAFFISGCPFYFLGDLLTP